MMSVIVGKRGFCFVEEIDRPDPQLIEKLKNYSTPNLADGMKAFQTMDPGIACRNGKYKLVGPAVTVHLRPGDNLMLHKSMELVKKGDVLVISTDGCSNYAVLGDLIVSAAVKLGVAGIVVDGGVRDIESLSKMDISIFARFVVPCCGDKDGPGEINLPIVCGGVIVNPGDVIVGDENGVVVVPKDRIEEVMANADVKLKYEAIRRDSIEKGDVIKPDINETLKKKGVILQDQEG